MTHDCRMARFQAIPILKEDLLSDIKLFERRNDRKKPDI